MNTRYGWGEPSDPGNQWSDLVDQQFFAEFFVNGMYHLGEAHALAWDEYIALIPSDTHYDWIAKSITLFGDPELPMWSDVPRGELSLGNPDFVNVGPMDITVTLADADGPLEGGRVCILQGAWDDPAAYEVAFTDASGQITISTVLAASPAELTITGWARNHAPVSVTIPVFELGTGGGEEPRTTFLGRPSSNPATGSVSFSWGVEAGEGRVEVRDLAGRLVDVILSSSEGSGRATWDLTDEGGSQVPAGVYLLRLSTQTGGSAVRRIVVVR
jgi:hypothetical protein